VSLLLERGRFPSFEEEKRRKVFRGSFYVCQRRNPHFHKWREVHRFVRFLLKKPPHNLFHDAVFGVFIVHRINGEKRSKKNDRGMFGVSIG